MSSETDNPPEPAVETGNEHLFSTPPATAPDDDEEMSDGTHQGDYEGDQVRRGTTITSARFQILSTMVNGGFLSLPLAFQQSGYSFLGPLVLITIAFITDFCFRLMVASANHLNPPDQYRPGKHSFESIASAAFGPKAYVLCMALVASACFFATIGYCVLLRDMVEPITDLIPPKYVPSQWLHKNFALFAVMVLATPLCTLPTFSALKSYTGAASMFSILILGSCIVFRSIQCNIDAPEPFYKYLTFFPESPRDLLDSVPIYISSFVCHFNIFPIYNDLQQPTRKRVSWWLRSTTWFAGILYLIMGFTGAAYGHCTETGRVQGNILLDFDNDDPLLMVGRMCLALTITLAFPMLVIPARDIVLRSILFSCLPPADALPFKEEVSTTEAKDENLEEGRRSEITETFLEDTEEEGGSGETTEALHETLEEDGSETKTPSESSSPTEHSNTDTNTSTSTSTAAPQKASFYLRLLTAIAIFWTAGGVASVVESIDIVWALLGSSLSILICFLIPCGSYLAITKDREGDVASKWLAWLLTLVFTPFMFLSTANAVNNTFFNK
jgi:amino acid permease